MPAGRPPLFESEEVLSKEIDKYFATDAWIETNDSKVYTPTLSGLAYHLGMTTQTLRDYGNKDKFSCTIKKARQKIEVSLEQRLAGNNVTGTIFNLKNNYGWKDKTEVDSNQTISVIELKKDFDEDTTPE